MGRAGAGRIQIKYQKEMKKLLLVISVLTITIAGFSQQKTYCNPINIDYGYTPIPNFSEWGRHRATADPVIVTYKGDYYLFSTNQWGYWWSNDMLNWKFISKKFLRPWNAGYMMNYVRRVLVSLAIRCWYSALPIPASLPSG